MINVMTDLESMGKGSHAAIAAIGACFFDPTKGVIGKTFYQPVDIESATDAGLVIDANTVKWWMKQSDEARELFRKKAYPLDTALQDFADFIEDNCPNKDDVQVWGNGAAFDNVILRNAFGAARIPVPWEFWNDRDVRTMVELGREVLGIDPKNDIPFEGVKHHALNDAIHQARYVSVIWQRLQGQAIFSQ